jgi:hypothetical protein
MIMRFMTTTNKKGNKKPSSGNIHVMERLVCTSSVVIAGQSSFIHLAEDHKPQCTPTRSESANKIFYPSDTANTQNPIPYIFGSTEELLKYLDLASRDI